MGWRLWTPEEPSPQGFNSAKVSAPKPRKCPPPLSFPVGLLVSGWSWGGVVSHAGAWAGPLAQGAGPRRFSAPRRLVSHHPVRHGPSPPPTGHPPPDGESDPTRRSPTWVPGGHAPGFGQRA